MEVDLLSVVIGIGGLMTFIGPIIYFEYIKKK